MKKKPHDAPVVIALDIETAPCEALVWRTGKQVVTIDQIRKPTSIISWSWAIWEKDKRVKARYESTFDQSDKRDDYRLVKSMHEKLSKATHVIAHNGARFDWPMIQGRFYEHGLPPIARPRVIDTMLIARQIGGQQSAKLSWLTRGQDRGKLSHSRFPGLSLWAEWLAGNPAAEREMRLYNNRDVESMCDLLNRMLPWARGQSIAGLVPHSVGREEETVVCPRCGSDHMVRRGFHVTQAGRYQRYQCADCHGWSTSRYMEREKRRHIVKPS